MLQVASPREPLACEQPAGASARCAAPLPSGGWRKEARRKGKLHRVFRPLTRASPTVVNNKPPPLATWWAVSQVGPVLLSWTVKVRGVDGGACLEGIGLRSSAEDLTSEPEIPEEGLPLTST